MAGDSSAAGSLVPADYVVFALMLAASTAIGVYYAWVARSNKNSRDFLTGGRRLTALPVSLSLTAGFMSSTTLLSNPADVYRFGAFFAMFSIGYGLSMVIVSEFYLPVFYRLATTSCYEYLELRFNRATRLLGTVLFMIQAVISGVDIWGGIISTGLVCTIYCTLGGLKAVVWTDVFQVGIMLAGYLSVVIKSVVSQGVHTIISDAQQGGRLNFLDFDINPLRRHTFWTVIIGSTFSWVSAYGAGQGPVQRYVSCKSITQARVTVSSNINALAAVTLEDLIKPYTNMSEKHLYWMSKGLTFLYGFVCISIAGLASVLGGMMQGGLAGVLSGTVASLCVTVGSQIYPSPPTMTRPLPLTTEGCNFTTTDILNWTSTALPTHFTTAASISDDTALSAAVWHSPSYLYFGPIGTVTAVVVGLIVSLCTGGWKSKSDSRFMLKKEDTTCYHLFNFCKDTVMRRAGKFDLEKVGNTNSAFCDREMDTIKTIPT
ncbi:uncharacterized protein V6R79_023933 [Siganus canaliculatus]